MQRSLKCLIEARTFATRLKAQTDALVRVLFRVHVRLCFQQHITYNSVTRSKSREKETEKKDTDGMQVRSKEKKEEKDRKDRKRVSV